MIKKYVRFSAISNLSSFALTDQIRQNGNLPNIFDEFRVFRTLFREMFRKLEFYRRISAKCHFTAEQRKSPNSICEGPIPKITDLKSFILQKCGFLHGMIWNSLKATLFRFCKINETKMWRNTASNSNGFFSCPTNRHPS